MLLLCCKKETLPQQAVLTKIAIEPATVEMIVGATVNLSAILYDQNNKILTDRAIIWKSSDSLKVSISKEGKILAIASGQVTITAASEGKSAVCQVTVSNIPIASVIVTPSTADIIVGDTLTLSAIPYDMDKKILSNRAIFWSSSDSLKVSVSKDGKILALAPGQVTITATSEGKSDTCQVKVSNIAIAYISVTPDSTKIQLGLNFQLTGVPLDVNKKTLTGRSITWSSSDASKAKVSDNGLVTPLSAGVVTITATSEGISGTAYVEIIKPPSTISYTSFEGSVSTLQPWFGKHIVLLTPRSDLDIKVMEEIVKSLDDGYEYYNKVTGREPVKWDRYTIDGRGTIASVDHTCGGACGFLGYTGIEMIHPWVDELYNDVRERGVHHTTFFYETGRNFWFYSGKLDFSANFKMNVNTGYSELMKYMATDYIHLPIRPAEAPTRKNLEGLADIYLAAPDWNWSKVIETGNAPAGDNQTTSAHLLFASLLLNLQKNYGGHTFIERFLKEADKRKPTTSVQDAIDNMAIAISAGANSNLSNILVNRWRITISQSVKDEAQQRFGDPI